jgi:phage anti-repressor protein
MSFLNSTDEVAELLNNPEALLTFIEEADKINQQTKHIFDFIGDESVWSSDLYEVLYPDSDISRLNKAASAAVKIEEGRFEEGVSFTTGNNDYLLMPHTAKAFVITEETEIGHLFRQALINKEKALRLHEIFEQMQIFLKKEQERLAVTDT